MSIFFTADTHFGQDRTRLLSKRPFENVSDMDRAIIYNWNRVVPSDADVYHLGDWGDHVWYTQILNGNIHLLPGNYETEEQIEQLAASGVQIIEPNHKFSDSIYLVHEPDEAIKTDKFFLFGHIHKLQMVKSNGLNVGVDCHNFTPLSLEEVLWYQTAIEEHYDHNVFMSHCGLQNS